MRAPSVLAAFLAAAVAAAVAQPVAHAQLTQSSGVAVEYGKTHDGVIATLAGGRSFT